MPKGRRLTSAERAKKKEARDVPVKKEPEKEKTPPSRAVFEGVPRRFREWLGASPAYSTGNKEGLPTLPEMANAIQSDLTSPTSETAPFEHAMEAAFTRLEKHLQQSHPLEGQKRPVIWIVGPSNSELVQLAQAAPHVILHVFDSDERQVHYFKQYLPGALQIMRKGHEEINPSLFEKPMGLEIHQGDIRSTKLPNTPPDAIVLHHVFKFFREEEQRALARRLFRVLRSGGVMLSTNHDRAVGQYKDPVPKKFHRVSVDTNPFHHELVNHPDLKRMEGIPTGFSTIHYLLSFKR